MTPDAAAGFRVAALAHLELDEAEAAEFMRALTGWSTPPAAVGPPALGPAAPGLRRRADVPAPTDPAPMIAAFPVRHGDLARLPVVVGAPE